MKMSPIEPTDHKGAPYDLNLESVDTGGKDGGGASSLVILKELAGGNRGVALGESPNPGGSELAAASVD